MIVMRCHRILLLLPWRALSAQARRGSPVESKKLRLVCEIDHMPAAPVVDHCGLTIQPTGPTFLKIQAYRESAPIFLVHRQRLKLGQLLSQSILSPTLEDARMGMCHVAKFAKLHRAASIRTTNQTRMYVFGAIATALPDLDSSLPSDRQTSQGWSAKFQHDYW